MAGDVSQLGLLQQIIAGSQPTTLDGMYNYRDPSISARTYDPLLTAIGFVKGQFPKELYKWSGLQGQNDDWTTAHEFEHTQQRAKNTRFPNDKWSYPDWASRQDLGDLNSQLYKYQITNPPKYQELSGEPKPNYDMVMRNNSNYREFLADLAGMYRVHQDPRIRQNIEQILKTKPDVYNKVQKHLYPTTPYMTDSDWSAPKQPRALDLLKQFQQLMRRVTSY